MPATESASTRGDPKAMLVAAAILAFGAIAAAVSESGAPTTLTDRVTWRALEEAERISAAARKPMLMFFTDQSPASARLEREIFGDRRLGPKLDRSFVLTRISDRRIRGFANPPATELLEGQYGISELPALVLVSSEGQPRTFVRYPSRQRAISFLFPRHPRGSVHQPTSGDEHE